jgi:AraC-like DNA-binding protein
MDAYEGIGHLERVVPNGFIELTFHFGDRLQKIKHTQELQPGIILCGQKTGFFDVLPTGKTQMLSIQFFPHSAGLFFDLPMDELSNETLDLGEIMGRAACELKEQLLHLQTLEQRVQHIERFLLRQLSRKTEYDWDRMVQNIKLIDRSNGKITLDELADGACLSRKQHERVFKKFVGLSPKKYLKIIRFQYTLFAHQQHPHESLTTLAYRCGYYDQSHMINDFKDLSGITPKQYFTDCETPYSDYF